MLCFIKSKNEVNPYTRGVQASLTINSHLAEAQVGGQLGGCLGLIKQRADGGTLHLDILIPSLPQPFQPVLSLARVDRRRRSDAGALALWPGRDSLHGVEVVRVGAPFFESSAGAPAQGSDNTFTPTVRAFREGFHFVIITQQLQRQRGRMCFPARSFKYV